MIKVQLKKKLIRVLEKQKEIGDSFSLKFELRKIGHNQVNIFKEMIWSYSLRIKICSTSQLARTSILSGK